MCMCMCMLLVACACACAKMLSAACAPRCGARPALDSRAHRASTHAPEANNCSGSARVRRQRRLHASRSASRSRSAAPAPSYSCSCCTPKRASAAHHQDRLEGRGAGRRAWRLQGAVRCADCGRVARRRDRRLVRLRRNSTCPTQPSPDPDPEPTQVRRRHDARAARRHPRPRR